MQQRLKPLVLSLCLLGFVTPVAANSQDAQAQRLERLQQQLSSLQHEVNALKSEKKATHSRSLSNSSSSTTPEVKRNATGATIETRAEASEKKEDKVDGATPISGPSNLPDSGIQYFPYDVDVPGQSFVSTGPYIGVPLQYSGSNLIINNPSINQDVALLGLRKNINQRLASIGLTPRDERPHLLLSGVVEGQAVYRNRGDHPNSNSSDINLTSAGIDAYVLGTAWTSALISLNYDGSNGANTGSFSNYSRTQNSRVVVNKAFIVLGNFSQSPWYGTIGQMYVPFGQYSSTMISSPLTKLVARTQARALLVGYQKQAPCAFYGALFAFRGDSRLGGTNRINNAGLNVGYKFDTGYYKGNFGGGVIANIADSQGMQNNGFSVVPLRVVFPPVPLVFTGFGGVSGSGSEDLVHRVPAYNVRGLFSFGPTLDLVAEYVIASTPFSRADMTMKSHQARPQALNVELAYSFQGLSKPLSLSGGYGMTKDSLALGLPAQRWSAVLNTSVWRNTLQSLEFRHDINYAASAYATGSGLPVPQASGSSDNIVTAQFDLFF